jgi:hypothetical protein
LFFSDRSSAAGNTKPYRYPKVGKVTLKSKGDEALSNEFLLKSNGDEALNDVFSIKSNGDEAFNSKKKL